MAAYAAAVSLMHIIDLIKNHPSPPISLDKQQFDSLTEIVTFLQEFLEGYVSPFSNSDEADPLEMRIAEAVYAAEDVIESYIVDNIHHANDNDDDNYDDDDDDSDDDDDGGGDGDDDVVESYRVESFPLLSIQLAAAATHHEDEQIRYFNFYQGLQKVMEAMGLIKKEAMEMEMKMEMVKEKGGLLEAELQRNISVDAGLTSSSIERKSEMVGFDDVRLELLDKLTGGDSNSQIIPIVGMGGIGKTTLARNVFADKFIEEHFDICVWATISLDHDIERTLREVLSQSKGTGRSSGDNSVAGLGEELYKCLFGRRYLVVMDDMWSIEVWDKIRNFFPNCNQRSRIIVTTRMSNLAAHLTNSSNSLCLSFLNRVNSWTLFSKIVFGIEGSDPDLELELREIGEKIVVKCRGLPLSIVVIGGLLAKSERTQGYWEYIENYLNSMVNLENEEYCLNVLKLSYNHLPAYLKPCFLYMGVFDEDSRIEVSTIINLWVSEGFVVQTKKKKNLLTIGREYLEELVDRNLLLADYEVASLWSMVELGSVGMRKMCRMHDLVRDVSLREAQRQRFYYVYSKRNPLPQDTSGHLRRIVIPKMITGGDDGLALESLPHSRSYVCHDSVWQFPDFRLLRILHTPFSAGESRYSEYRQNDVFGLVNLRLLAIMMDSKFLHNDYVLLSSISRLWSLHTLLVFHLSDLEGPAEFWNMHQLKHVEFTRGRLRLPLPPNDDDNIIILENVHTLIGMKDFHVNEDVFRRMPNLTTFGVHYEKKMNKEVHSLSYLQCLDKLESFRCSIIEESGVNLLGICFPRSLKQIILLDDFYSRHIEWEDVLQKIGELRLPFLEELSIEGGFFESGEWETTEGQFPRLKSLQLSTCRGLEYWRVLEASHFPLLQNLILLQMEELEEIPSEIGEIATLKSIGLSLCSESAVLSAKKIVEEQEDLYGVEELSFHVLAVVENEELESLASPNFIVKLR